MPFVPRRLVKHCPAFERACSECLARPSARAASPRSGLSIDQQGGSRSLERAAPVEPVSRTASGDVTIITGPAASVENRRASGDRTQAAVEDDARQRPFPVDQSRGEQRIVHEQRFRADGNRVDLRPLIVCVAWQRPLRSARVRSPGAAAIRPSRLVAALRITNGRLLAHRRQERLIQAHRLVALPTPTSTVMPCSRSAAKPRPCTSGYGSSIAAHDARDAGGDDPLGARARCGRCARTARACSRASRRGRARPLPRARAPRRAAPLRVRDNRRRRRRSSASTTQAPTTGLGVVRPRPRRACSSARRIHRSVAGGRLPLLLEQRVDVLLRRERNEVVDALTDARRSESAA